MNSSHELPDVSLWVRRFAHLLPKSGPILDLACGGGRHGRWLLEQGHSVVFVDRDLSGLEDLGQTERCRIVVFDLEAETGPADFVSMVHDHIGALAGIVVTNYLHRPLLPLLPNLLGEDGVLLYETFAIGNERFGRPKNPDFLLKENELANWVISARPRLHLSACELGDITHPKPATISRVVAVRAEHPAQLALEPPPRSA